jgi:hypothetical protein
MIAVCIYDTQSAIRIQAKRGRCFQLAGGYCILVDSISACSFGLFFFLIFLRIFYEEKRVTPVYFLPIYSSHRLLNPSNFDVLIPLPPKKRSRQIKSRRTKKKRLLLPFLPLPYPLLNLQTSFIQITANHPFLSLLDLNKWVVGSTKSVI